MSLLDEYFEDFYIMIPDRLPDGEGGFANNGWKEDVMIKAVAIKDSTMSARVAEREGVTSVYTITTNKSVILPYHTVLKRVSDGRIIRTTSDPDDVNSATPQSSTLDMRQVLGEKWELTR